MRRTIHLCLLAAALGLPAMQVGATDIDLTTAGTCSGDIGAGASACSASDGTNVGTGTWGVFLKSSTNDASYGMYSSSLDKDAGNPVSDPWTYSPTLGMLGVLNIGGVDVYAFALDSDQQAVKDGSSLLRTDGLKIYVDGTGMASAATLAASTALWSMNAGLTLVTDYNNNSGSGLGVDMFLYIPTSIFTGYSLTTHLYLFNSNSNANDGPEEWKAYLCETGANNCTPPPPPPEDVPEPGTLALLGLGLLGLGAARRRQS